jgi:endonuclease YncB( thermonuclease family)
MLRSNLPPAPGRAAPLLAPRALEMRRQLMRAPSSSDCTAWARAAAALGAAALVALTAPPASLAREDLAGAFKTASFQAKVVDGDTLIVDGTRVRLFGIDAPETNQTCSRGGGGAYACGAEAKAALEAKIGGKAVRCEGRRKDMYGRTVAVCLLDAPALGGAPAAAAAAAPEDLNAWLVQQGYAVAYRRYSQRYVAAEDEAHDAGRGIWAGAFEEPQAWRKEHPRGRAAASSTPAPPPPAPPLAQPPPPSCAVKGNVTAKGEKVYHLPGGRFYEATKIDTSAGEQWFCSAAAASAAGWRPARS